MRLARIVTHGRQAFRLFLIWITIFAGTGSISPVRAQPSANPAVSPSRPPPVSSPEVQADHRVTFRLQAPKADSVFVSGQWANGREQMTKDSVGLWSVTVGPIEPGVWEYSFQVNGLTMIDPGNSAIKPMRQPRTSILHLPGQPPLLHDFQDVPHDVVRLHAYLSKSLGRMRELAVYTPPDYDRKPKARFPTLYLQHGSGDNQGTWTVHGKAHWILDNLIAQGRAKPMVVVMMDGHAAIPGDNTGGPQDNTVLFERDLLEDVMPFIWIGCGKDDFLLKRNEEFLALLQEKHIRYEWHLTDGAHTWPVWRIYLGEFAPRLFQ